MKRGVEFQMTDIDALIERLFPVTSSEILRDYAALDFSFVVPPKVSQTVDILPNMHADISVAKRFNVTLRTIRERACSRNLGRKLGGTRWFTEAEIIGLMTCSSSPKDTVLNSGRRGANTSGSKLTKAFELSMNIANSATSLFDIPVCGDMATLVAASSISPLGTKSGQIVGNGVRTGS